MLALELLALKLIVIVFQDYSVEGMSESLLTFLQHLREFGLVFQRKVRLSCISDTISAIISLDRIE